VIIRIVSGGQTGVDRAALDFARDANIPSGGWCPAGRTAEDGIISVRYPLQEIPQGGYHERTWKNVLDSDGTLIIYNDTISGGTDETLQAAKANRKPFCLIDAAHMPPEKAATKLAAFMHRHDIKRLNIAGPRASQWCNAYTYTRALLMHWAATP